MLEVSVLVPVRDALPWLPSSFASLWRQKLRPFEVIAVDDGSRDGSGEWLEREAVREPRLRVVRTAPRGLPAALNTALALARAPLVARHDADDLSHRDRFALQAGHLDAHPETGVVGSRVRLFPASGFGAGMRRWAAWHNALLTHEAMRREALIDSPLAHGCAMIRRCALEDAGGWAERGWAEDLDLWLRLLERGVRFDKLGRELYGWRQHAASSTRVDPRYSRERFLSLKIAALDRVFLKQDGPVTLVGTGESLARWRDALGPRVTDVHDCRRPTPSVLAGAGRRHVLIYVSRTARIAWRAQANELGLSEMADFIFVS